MSTFYLGGLYEDAEAAARECRAVVDGNVGPDDVDWELVEDPNGRPGLVCPACGYASEFSVISSEIRTVVRRQDGWGNVTHIESLADEPYHDCVEVACSHCAHQWEYDAGAEHLTIKEEMVERIAPKEFQDFGFLQEVNREYLHPLGMALEVIVNDETGDISFGGIWDYRDDPEGLRFRPENIDQEKVKQVAKFKRERWASRLKKLGYTIQPAPLSNAKGDTVMTVWKDASFEVWAALDAFYSRNWNAPEAEPAQILAGAEKVSVDEFWWFFASHTPQELLFAVEGAGPNRTLYKIVRFVAHSFILVFRGVTYENRHLIGPMAVYKKGNTNHDV